MNALALADLNIPFTEGGMEEKLPHTPGVYAINFDQDGRFYIGSTKDLYVRWRDHRSSLRGHYHYNPHLQRLVDKYGVESLEFVVLEFTSAEDRVEREQWYMDNWLPALNGARMANGGFAGPHTDDARQKMSDARQNQPPMSEKTRAKISASAMGHTRTKGIPKSPEHRKAIGDANRGSKRTEEQKANMRGRPRSEDAKEKQRQAMTGRRRSQESIDKQLASRKGYRHSEETKAKIAETNRITWATRRRQNGNTDSQSPEGTTPS